MFFLYCQGLEHVHPYKLDHGHENSWDGKLEIAEVQDFSSRFSRKMVTYPYNSVYIPYVTQHVFFVHTYFIIFIFKKKLVMYSVHTPFCWFLEWYPIEIQVSWLGDAVASLQSGPYNAMGCFLGSAKNDVCVPQNCAVMWKMIAICGI